MNKRAFVSLSFAIFVAMLGMGIISPLMPLYLKSLASENLWGGLGFWLGLMYSGFSLSRAIMQPIAGWFSDSKGRKGILIIGLGAYTLISLGYAMTANLYQLTAVRLLHGLASAMVIPVAQAYVGDICPPGKEGTYINLFSMSMQLGMAAGPMMGGFLSEAYSMNTAFYVMAAFAATGLLLLILFVPRTETQVKREKVARPPMSAMLKDDRVKAAALYMSSRGILRQAISAFLPLFAVGILGLSVSISSVIVSTFILTEAFSIGIMGPIADRFDKRKLMIFGAIITPTLGCFLPYMKGTAGLLAVLIPLGMLTSLARASAMAYSVESGRRHHRMGGSMGIIHTAMDIGHFIGPMATGWAYDTWGLNSVFAVSAVTGFAAIPFVAWWLIRSKETAEAVIPAVQEEQPAHSHD